MNAQRRLCSLVDYALFPKRVVFEPQMDTNGHDSEYLSRAQGKISFFPPPEYTEKAFEQALKLQNGLISKLKNLLEKRGEKRKEEFMKAIDSSDRTYEEILRFIRS